MPSGVPLDPSAATHTPACHPWRRHYGGVKLGAGGLVRAYGGAARDCLRSAPKQHVTPKLALRLQVCACMHACGHPVGHAVPSVRPRPASPGMLPPAKHLPPLPGTCQPQSPPLPASPSGQVPFELLGAVYPLLEQHDAQKQEESYDDAAGVTLVVACDSGRAEALRGAIADATSGRVLAVTAGAG